jgi:hypothetical protein
MDSSALAARIAANDLFRERALHDPHRLLQDWGLDADVLHEAAQLFGTLDLTDGARREGHAALFSLLAAAR